jgi:hypothetical protein
LGSGKSSFAEALVNGLGGDGVHTRWVLESLEGSWTLIDNSDLRKEDWSRLIELVDNSKDHVVVLVVSDLERVPRAVQSRATRVYLRHVSDDDLKAYSENILVSAKIAHYTEGALNRMIRWADRDFRQVKNILELAKLNGALDEAFIDSLGSCPRDLVERMFEFLVDGYLPEAKELADKMCEEYGLPTLVTTTLNVYSEAQTKSLGGLGSRIVFRFPSCSKTTDVLLKWSKDLSAKVGAAFIEELNLTGIRIEDPRVVAARKKEEEARAGEILRGRPELNLDPSKVANRLNPDIPLWEDRSVPMDPRVRAQLKTEAEEAQKKERKKAHMIPSAVFAEGAMSDTNPFGLRIPPPTTIPKGVVLGTAFAKKTKARKLEPEEKWDIVYSEKSFNTDLRAHLVELTHEKSGRILSESKEGIVLTLPQEIVKPGEMEFKYEVVSC